MIALLLAALSLQTAPPDPPAPQDVDALEAEAEEARAASEAARAEADRIADEIAALQARLIEAAERVRRRGAAASEAELRFEELSLEAAMVEARLELERDSLNRVLAALQRIEGGAPPALAVSPGDAAKAARAAGLLSRAAPALSDRARAYAERLAELEALRDALDVQGETVADARAALAETRAEVDGLIAEKLDAERRLRAEAEDLSRRAARIADQAGDLRDLMADIRRFAAAEPRLNPRRGAVESGLAVDEASAAPPDLAGAVPTPRLRPRPSPALVAALPADAAPDAQRFADARGRLSPPAGGRLIAGAGESGPDGVARGGVWFETRPGAPVTAPFDGVVVYSGVFQTFDGVLMINTPDGYTLVLAGLGLIYVIEGQTVLAGEPVGLMSEGAQSAPRLYLEIWRDADQAEDPERWLRREHRRRG